MKQTSIEELDKLDRRILSTLLSNGRESIANMARKIGLSRTAVAERMNRMEKTGIIKGYTAQVNFSDELPKMASYLLIKCNKGEKKLVCEKLVEIPEIKTTSVVGGNFDVIVLLEATSLHMIHMLCDEIEAIPGIEELMTTVVLHQPIDRSASSTH